MARHRQQAGPRRLRQPLDGVEIHAKVDLGGDLVHVLAAGAGGAHGALGQRAGRHADGVGDHDRLAHVVIVVA
jgi:hypothetical protein